MNAMSSPSVLSKRLLQVTQGILAATALRAGAVTLWYGARADGDNALPTYIPGFDSMMRFVGGLWLGIALLLAWGIPRIEHKGPALRAAWLLVLCGGLGRCVSLLQYGAASPEFIVSAVVEVLAPPLMMLWQLRLAPAARGPR